MNTRYIFQKNSNSERKEHGLPIAVAIICLMTFAILFGITAYLLFSDGVGAFSGAVRSRINPCYGSSAMGTHGRFQIPDLGIDVALYDSNGNAQEIVDALDSAVFHAYGTSDGYIGDHCSEDGGFCWLRWAVEGKTIAKIVYADGSTEEWICRHKYWDCLLHDGCLNIGTGQNPKDIYDGGIWTFTCLDKTGIHQIGIWWERVENSPSEPISRN